MVIVRLSSVVEQQGREQAFPKKLRGTFTSPPSLPEHDAVIAMPILSKKHKTMSPVQSAHALDLVQSGHPLDLT